ncbi:FAST kinase domain-containing protein 2, mitochondrial [Ctenopharyngodon idella]|uniref:FAST kinase domain-containing protein 2, mitochondrial n=1 Tax=Ctenopharyngodon idella TaxID=7959 RepID=UPI00223062B4|nr:FAST kinase domain-containing protein 2, mitochondrial [Ctenopharyngodon idella]XP_051761215.1 FAST kinase domain-containing protein 2, mitochondrial [Ctenopharyngodon idella]XP_051761224.1 FAST kinase domain-containing protein 2, mitochondrial [Ctenopharyngodon idella]XP_051761233.1 FAST kinase domain-containing protein 2, mitochondrial [Ctenopharyngodon idella]
MSMYKSGLEMLRCTLRSTPLWKYDSFIWTQTSLCYKSRNFAASSQFGRKHIQGHTLKQVRYYCQSGHDVLNAQIKQTPASTKTSELLDKAERTPFYSHLQNCYCPTDVLDTLKQFPVSQQLISSIFTRIWESTKKMTDEQRRCELRLMFDHLGFEEVCERATTDAWRMRSEDLAYTLLAIVNLGVSQDTHVVQTLLRVIQERLNQFDIRSLSVLAACIREMENGRNVQALREALRLLLKDRIPEIQSVVVLQSMMRAVGKNSPIHLKKQLATKTLSLADEFSPPNTQYMFSSLAAMGLNFKPLLDVCSKNIAENVHEFPFGKLLSVLKSCHELRYRNYTLFSSVSEYMTNTFDMWSNKQVILILVSFEDLLFRPVVLLDAFAERIIQKPDSLTLKDLLSVLKVFSLLNHDLKEKKTEFLSSVVKVLESYLPKMSPTDLLKAVYYLALLEHIPQTLLDKLLQQETLDQIQKGKQSNKVQRWLHTLDLCLRLDQPQLPPSLRSIPDLNFTVPAHDVPVNQEMLSAIRSIVGNDAVQDSVLEQSIYFIDCVITLPHPKEETCGLRAEDSGSPECARRIAVVCAPPTSFCFGTTHPRASLVIKLRHLEKLGYKPVLVPVHELNSKTEEEKIQMLQKLICPAQESSGMQEILNNSPKEE